MTSPTPPAPAPVELSARELECLLWASHGRTNAEIATKLGLAEDSIKSHMRKIFRKLRARDRAHAVRIGFETGVLTGGRAPSAPPPSPPRLSDPRQALYNALLAQGWTPPLEVLSQSPEPHARNGAR